MWNMYDPTQGTVDRVSFLALEPDGTLRDRPVRACWNHVLGHYHEEGPEWEKHSQIGPDPEYVGLAGDYHAVLMAVWATDDRGQINREFLGHVEFKVWLMSKWVWRSHHFDDYPPGQHDYQIRCNHHRPYQHYDVTPCRERVLNKLSKPLQNTATEPTLLNPSESRGRISDQIRAAVEAQETAWREHTATLIPYLPLEMVESRMALHHGQQDYYDHIQKWKRRDEPEPPPVTDSDLDAVFANLLDEDEETPGQEWDQHHIELARQDLLKAWGSGKWAPPLPGIARGPGFTTQQARDTWLHEHRNTHVQEWWEAWKQDGERDEARSRLDQLLSDMLTDPGRARAIRQALAAGGQ